MLSIVVAAAIFSPVNAEEASLLVNEIYTSIQGESSYAGLPCVFVRLTGCNLRCTYCDTEYAFTGGERRTIQSVVDQVRGFQIPLVEITGGEPLLQKGCVTLAERLLSAGFSLLIETSGALPISNLPAAAIRIMDIKCPSSGESDKMCWDNIDALKAADEVKFVIGTREDYEWARAIMGRYRLHERCPVLMSTVFEALEPKMVAGWILEDRLPVRFQLQMHKYIWDPRRHGV